MRYAIISEGVVINVAISESAIFDNWILIPEGLPVGIGWLYVDDEFVRA
jgi:hypothetical protein